MKKALFILMTFALIGFAGCKQATGSSSGGGGGGDTNPLIGTWERTYEMFKEQDSHGNPNSDDYMKIKDVLIFTSENYSLTSTLVDGGKNKTELIGTVLKTEYFYKIGELGDKNSFWYKITYTDDPEKNTVGDDGITNFIIDNNKLYYGTSVINPDCEFIKQ